MNCMIAFTWGSAPRSFSRGEQTFACIVVSKVRKINLMYVLYHAAGLLDSPT